MGAASIKLSIPQRTAFRFVCGPRRRTFQKFLSESSGPILCPGKTPCRIRKVIRWKRRVEDFRQTFVRLLYFEIVIVCGKILGHGNSGLLPQNLVSPSRRLFRAAAKTENGGGEPVALILRFFALTV